MSYEYKFHICSAKSVEQALCFSRLSSKVLSLRAFVFIVHLVRSRASAGFGSRLHSQQWWVTRSTLTQIRSPS